MALQNTKDRLERFKNKVSDVFASGNEKHSVNLNPFLNKSGNLVNPYLNYQKILDSSDTSSKVKSLIQEATGLSPTVSVQTPSAPVQTPAQTAAPAQPDGATTPVRASSSDNNIVNAAQRYVGTPYVWGGESIDEGGMDCSGFVYNALKDAGYKVGRETAQGYRKFGNTVSKSDMQPGDLIFYGKNTNDASHIGIYLGNGKMIHSSGGSKNTKDNPGKGVTVADVDYRSDFIEARRY